MSRTALPAGRGCSVVSRTSRPINRSARSAPRTGSRPIRHRLFGQLLGRQAQRGGAGESRPLEASEPVHQQQPCLHEPTAAPIGAVTSIRSRGRESSATHVGGGKWQVASGKAMRSTARCEAAGGPAEGRLAGSPAGTQREGVRSQWATRPRTAGSPEVVDLTLRKGQQGSQHRQTIGPLFTPTDDKNPKQKQAVLVQEDFLVAAAASSPTKEAAFAISARN